MISNSEIDWSVGFFSGGYHTERRFKFLAAKKYNCHESIKLIIQYFLAKKFDPHVPIEELIQSVHGIEQPQN